MNISTDQFTNNGISSPFFSPKQIVISGTYGYVTTTSSNPGNIVIINTTTDQIINSLTENYFDFPFGITSS